MDPLALACYALLRTTLRRFHADIPLALEFAILWERGMTHPSTALTSIRTPEYA